jgi:cell division protein ZapA
MAQVVVTIAGRTYRMNCDEGEEAHIESLALSVDAKIAELRGSFGEIGDQRIIVMAALTLADELFGAQKKLGERDEKLEEARAQAEREETRRRQWALDAAAAMNEAAEQVEAATRALNQGRG